MSEREQLVTALAPLARAVSELNLSDPAAATARRERSFGERERAAIGALLRAGRDAGWLTPKRATPTLSFGRVASAGPETAGMSIDVVDMEGAGMEHTHPQGEVSLCFSESGDPRFCGEPGPFVVLAPGSHHTPEVAVYPRPLV